MIAVDNHALTKRNFRLKKHGKLFDLIAWYQRWSQLFRQFLSVISGSLPPLVRLPVVWTVG